MKVTLIDYTGKGSLDPWYAANLLIFTKSTRLEMHPGLLNEIAQWPEERKIKELEYMANTIPSSWEFVDLTFMIEGVTRGFTHQFVRTRTASFAQQTMRVLNVKGWTYGTGPTINDAVKRQVYHGTMQLVKDAYDALVADGAAIEDARGVLPTNIHTNICVKMNLRTFCEMARKRASSRTQGEYREVIEAMKASVLSELPWASVFLDRSFDRAASELEQWIRSLGNISESKRTDMIKLIDQMRMMA